MPAEYEGGFARAERSWHGLETLINHDLTPEEARRESTLMWNVFLDQLYRRMPNILDDTTYHQQVNQMAITRDSDHSILGFATAAYECWQNSEAFEWIQPFVDSGLWKYETAGSLKGGKTCWILLKRGEMNLDAGETMKQYMLINWGHDGGTSVNIKYTSVRVVCWNTLQMALYGRDKDGKEQYQRVSHSKMMRVELDEVQRLFEYSERIFDNQTDYFKTLLDRPVTYQEKEGFIKSLIPIVDNTTERTKNGQIRIRSFLGQIANGLVESASTASMNEDVRNSAYGLLMGVTEANEHYLGGKKVKDRGWNILSGTGRRRNNGAVELMETLMAAPVGQAFADAQ